MLAYNALGSSSQSNVASAVAPARPNSPTSFSANVLTPSSYALETIRLFSAGQVKQGLLNIVVNNLAALVLAGLGMGLSKAMIR